MTELLTCGNGFPLVGNERETSESLQEGRIVRAELNAIQYIVLLLRVCLLLRGDEYNSLREPPNLYLKYSIVFHIFQHRSTPHPKIKVVHRCYKKNVLSSM